MSNNRKIIMLGSVSAADVEQALRGYGATSVSVTPSSIPHRSRINFKQAGDGEDRMMVVCEADSYRENGNALHKGMHTLAMLGAWGEYEQVVAALFRVFQGYVLEDTASGLVRVVPDAAAPSADLARSAAEAAASAMDSVLGDAMPPRARLVEDIVALLLKPHAKTH